MKRRRWKPEQTALILLEGLKGRQIGDLCAEHEISQAQYYQWRDQFLANVAKAFEPAGAPWRRWPCSTACRPTGRPRSVDRGFDARDFVMELPERRVTPHIAQNTSGRRLQPDPPAQAERSDGMTMPALRRAPRTAHSSRQPASRHQILDRRNNAAITALPHRTRSPIPQRPLMGCGPSRTRCCGHRFGRS